MEMQQGGWLSAIEQSWLGVLARESLWLYPTANVLHILALTVFAASVAMMASVPMDSYCSSLSISTMPARSSSVGRWKGAYLP